MRENENKEMRKILSYKARSWLKKIFPTSRRLLIEKSLSSLELSDYDKVLIVGSGSDPYRHLFNSVDQYLCLDIKKTNGVTNVIADAMALPFLSAKFDCILTSEVMEHLSDPALFVKELTRVLKPGGSVLLTVPFIFHHHADPYDYWRPTHQGIKDLFSSFSEIKIIRQGNRLHVIWDLITTTFAPYPIFFPLRILNHVLVRLPGSIGGKEKGSSAVSGFLLVSKK